MLNEAWSMRTGAQDEFLNVPEGKARSDFPDCTVLANNSGTLRTC